MFLFAGLGNPGKNYSMSRHNAGFMVVDKLAKSYHFPDWQKKRATQQSVGHIQSTKIILLKPQIFMNKSGLPIAETARFHKIPVENIFVFHDDLDLAAGRLRVKQGGGHGGHNGLRDIDQHLGQNYWRVRIGIGRAVNPAIEVKTWVLADFTKEEVVGWLAILINAVCDEAPRLIHYDSSGFMNSIALLAPSDKNAHNTKQRDI